MTSVFKNVLAANIGTSPNTVLTSNASANTTIIGMSLTNTTSEPVLASIYLTDPNGGGIGYSTSAYYIKNVPIPGNQSLRVINGGEKLIVGPSTVIQILSNVDSSIDVVMSWVEIS
jgi:hypothetical protein